MFRIFLILLVTLQACASMPRWLTLSHRDTLHLQDVAYSTAEKLDEQLSGTEVPRYSMLAATFVDSADVDATNDLGRLLSQQIASRLSQRGYSVAEIQLRSDRLGVRQKAGVFALSQDLGQINADVSAYSVLVGTYTILNNRVYVNARVLRADDGVALAAADFSIPQEKNLLPRPRGEGAKPSVTTLLQ